MYLTRAEVFTLPAASFADVGTLCNAVYDRFSCGIAPETAARIIRDYRAYTTAKTLHTEKDRAEFCSVAIAV